MSTRQKKRRMLSKAKTTPNVAKAQARERVNRALRKAQELGEAKKLGISVDELRKRKYEEVLKIRENPPSLSSTTYSRSSSGWNW